MERVMYTHMDVSIGRVRVAWGPKGLVSVALGAELDTEKVNPGWQADPDLRCPATDQLRSYFEGRLRRFDLPLVLSGTPFQKRVWMALAEIPYGETISYAELAERVGNPRAVRAVGAANGRNPLPIVLPCHRVIGKDGQLRGYAGGVDVKAALLELERGVRALPFGDQAVLHG